MGPVAADIRQCISAVNRQWLLHVKRSKHGVICFEQRILELVPYLRGYRFVTLFYLQVYPEMIKTESGSTFS